MMTHYDMGAFAKSFNFTQKIQEIVTLQENEDTHREYMERYRRQREEKISALPVQIKDLYEAERTMLILKGN